MSMSRSLSAGAALAAVLVFLSLLGAWWTPHDPLTMNIAAKLAPSSSLHWLGTDHFGRDLASMMLAGLHHSLTIAIGAVCIGGGIGTALGWLAAMTNSRIFDGLLSRGADFMFVFPALLTAIMLSTLYGASQFNAIIAIAIFNIPVFFRITRALAMNLLNRDYIRAATAMGRTRTGILFAHIVPGSAGVLAVQISIQLSLALLAEAGLSYLGLGVPPPEPSLGRMLQDAQTYMTIYPRLAILPGLAIAVAVLAFNLLGDGLRDRFDPRFHQHFF